MTVAEEIRLNLLASEKKLMVILVSFGVLPFGSWADKSDYM